MKRIRGFLNIDGYFIKKYKRKYVDELIQKLDSLHYIINIDGQEYYFKKTKYPYTELLAYEVANFLGFDAIPYDLALFQNVYGVISPNFQKENCNYISGQELLFAYSRAPKNLKSLERMGLVQSVTNTFPKDAPYSYNINNLEIIWQAIEWRYKSLNIEIDTKQIMDKLIDYFIFNMLTSQSDGMAQNWILEESSDGVTVVPIFDNELCFHFEDYATYPTSNLCTNFNDVGRGNYKILEEFLKVSSKEFIDLFCEKFESLTLYEFAKLISNIETKIGCNIPEPIKNQYIEIFCLNRQNIQEVLQNYNIKRNN